MSTLPELQTKFDETEQSMNNRLVERSTLVRTLLLATIGKLDVFGLGIPGVAKTLTATTLRDHISDMPPSGYFWRLLTKFTTPPELFGPPDLLAMEKGVWRHQTDGTLVDANFALLDEVFNANSAILNTLLTFMNERKFHNDEVIDVPIWTIMGFSNGMPQGEELNALYDRFDFRLVVERIQSSSGFVQMLKSKTLGPIEPSLTMADVAAAQQQVEQVQITNEVYEALLALRKDLGKEGVEPSDRRFVQALQIIRASAWMRGGDSAEIDDMRDLRHSLWTSPDEKMTVDTVVLRLASPLEAEAMELRAEVDKLSEDFDQVFDADNETTRNRQAIGLHTKIDRATEELLALQQQLAPGRRSEVMDSIESRLAHMAEKILREVFNLDPTQRTSR